MALETSITNNILKYLNGLDECIAEKVMGNSFQFGRPDINACWRGQSVRIEVKTADHGNKASKAQKINLKRWKRAGAVCIVAYSVEDVKKYINEDGLCPHKYKDWDDCPVCCH